MIRQWQTTGSANDLTRIRRLWRWGKDDSRGAKKTRTPEKQSRKAEEDLPVWWVKTVVVVPTRGDFRSSSSSRREA